MNKAVKIIFHIDLNAFFATVAQITDPYLKDKVFVVGGSIIPNHGIISTASYKARALGIKSGMAVAEAMKIFPKVLIVPPDYEKIKIQSNLFFDFLSQYSQKMIRGSIDEAYLDITELSETRHPLEIAKEIQTKLNNDYGLPVSIGIGPTLFLAKMASDLKKPLGITVIRRRDIPKKIFPLSIKELFGMGVKTYPLMIRKNIKTIGDFANPDNKDKILTVLKEETYISFMEHILGRSTDFIDVHKYDIPKSISNETTFVLAHDKTDLLLDEMYLLLDTVYKRLKKGKFLAKTVTIKLRTSDFETKTRSKSLLDYTDSYEELKRNLDELFLDNFNDQSIRLIGFGVSNIIPSEDYREDYNLFTYQKLLAD